MKNLKNILAGASLAAVLMVGATSANAGLMISDRGINTNQPAPCSTTIDTMSDSDGIIIIGRAITGLLISDRVSPNTCTSAKDGLLISD